MHCDKGMIESLTIAKEELRIAYYRVINGKYYDLHTVDSALNMFARFVLDCRLRLEPKLSLKHQDEDRLNLFVKAQKSLENAYSALSRLSEKQIKKEKINKAIEDIEACEAIELTEAEIIEN